MKIYRNNKSIARILCDDRPGTVFCMLSLDKDGTLYHHRKDGLCTSSGWDIIDMPDDHKIGLEFPDCSCSNCSLAHN